MSYILPTPIARPDSITEADFISAAKVLRCEVAAIKAVAEVEAPKGAFLASGRPTILFEAHIFSQKTARKYDKTHPLISSRKWDRTLYRGGEKEYDRLQMAISLDPIAALQSASWGKFQLMGFNHRLCGWDSIGGFVADMYRSEKSQLTAFIGYVRGRNLDDEIRDRRWTEFAHGYNGPAHAENDYAGKMARAYIKHKKLEGIAA